MSLNLVNRLYQRYNNIKVNKHATVDFMSTEFTKPPRRRRGQLRLKNDFILYLQILRDTLGSLTLLITVKTMAKLNPEHGDKFEIKSKEIGRRGSRSPDNARFGHVTFCGGRQED